MEYHCPHCKPDHGGRFFKNADPADLALFDRARESFLSSSNARYVPDEPIQEGDETTRLLRWGYRRFSQLFNARQLLGLTTLCDEIASVEDAKARDALATAFSDCLRYQNMLARYDTYALKCQDIFSVHGFPVGLVQCEDSLLGIEGVGSGSFRHILAKYIAAKEYCQQPFEKKIQGKRKTRVAMSPERIEANLVSRMPRPSEERAAWLECDSSENLDLPEASVDAVLTDPPYYDNVQYAELMDFCYVWLRQLLQGVAENFHRPLTRNESELTGNVSAGRDILHFTQGLSDIYCAAARALKPYGLFAFTYHHNDLEAYVPIAVALCDAGLCVTAALPCPAEMGASLHISGTGSSVVDTILCTRKVEHRGRQPDKPQGREALEARLSDQARSLSEGDVQVTDGDLRCMALGILTGWVVNSLLGRWQTERPLEQ
jgi:adenine-specific DNA methylase